MILIMLHDPCGDTHGPMRFSCRFIDDLSLATPGIWRGRVGDGRGCMRRGNDRWNLLMGRGGPGKRRGRMTLRVTRRSCGNLR